MISLNLREYKRLKQIERKNKKAQALLQCLGFFILLIKNQLNLGKCCDVGESQI
jgi:hypothetical protein